MEDYGFEYSDDDYAEEDVDIEISTITQKVSLH